MSVRYGPTELIGSIRNKQIYYRKGLRAMALIQQAFYVPCRPLKPRGKGASCEEKKGESDVTLKNTKAAVFWVICWSYEGSAMKALVFFKSFFPGKARLSYLLVVLRDLCG